MSHPEFKYWEDQGMVLTPEGEALFYEWEFEVGGCTCFLGHPPCNSCTHEGHPISLAESPEYWESDLEQAIRAVVKGTLNEQK